MDARTKLTRGLVRFTHDEVLAYRRPERQTACLLKHNAFLTQLEVVTVSSVLASGSRWGPYASRKQVMRLCQRSVGSRAIPSPSILSYPSILLIPVVTPWIKFDRSAWSTSLG